MILHIDKLLAGRQTVWLVLFVMLLQTAVFWSTAVDMASLWRISVYKHCWIIAPLVLLLVGKCGRQVERQPFTVTPMAFVLLPLIAAVWLIGDRASIRALEHLAFVAIVVFSVLAVLGWRKFRELLFPMGLLFAAVPIGGFMIPTLMDWTADISAALLELTGIPAWRQGAIIALPNGRFHVAEVCSGISFVLAGLILSLIYSWLVFKSLHKRIIFVTVTVVSFILLNGIRAFIVMIVANATEMRWFTGWDHIYFGQFLFFCLAVTLFVVGERFSDAGEGPVEEYGGPAIEVPVVGVAMRAAVTVLLTFGLLRVAVPLLAPSDGQRLMPAVALSIQGCGEERPWSEAYLPELPGAVDTTSASFDCELAEVGHYVGFFDDPQAGSELVNGQHRYWPDEWAQIGTQRAYAAPLATGELVVGELSFQQSGRTRLVWYVYTIGDRVTANRYMAKFWEALYSINGAQNIASLHVVTSDLEGDRQSARQTLASYLAVSR